jgi:hypothetical protein
MGHHVISTDTCDKCSKVIAPPMHVLRFHVSLSNKHISKIACSDACIVGLLNDAATEINAPAGPTGPTGPTGPSAK